MRIPHERKTIRKDWERNGQEEVPGIESTLGASGAQSTSEEEVNSGNVRSMSCSVVGSPGSGSEMSNVGSVDGSRTDSIVGVGESSRGDSTLELVDNWEGGSGWVIGVEVGALAVREGLIFDSGCFSESEWKSEERG